MKVLHIISNLGPGGAEKLIEESLPIMNKLQDIEVDLLLLSDQGNVFDKNLKKNGINIDVISIRHSRNPLNIFQIRKYIAKGNMMLFILICFQRYIVSIASKLIFKNKPKFFQYGT